MDIKKAIKAHGSNLSKVADALHITQPALSQQINGKSITLERVRQIAEILGCTPAELIADDDEAVIITCPHCGKTIRLKIDEEA